MEDLHCRFLLPRQGKGFEDINSQFLYLKYVFDSLDYYPHFVSFLDYHVYCLLSAVFLPDSPSSGTSGNMAIGSEGVSSFVRDRKRKFREVRILRVSGL